ncbi:MAG: hypothetical protein R3E64_13715 [Halioglobus sp.]
MSLVVRVIKVASGLDQVKPATPVSALSWLRMVIKTLKRSANANIGLQLAKL